MKQKLFWKKILLLAILFVISLASLAGFVIYTFATQLPATQNPSIDKETLPTDKVNHSMNILLIGLDEGDPDFPDNPHRSDAMMVVNIDSENKKVTLLSIPRDSRVMISGHDNYDKINNAYFFGGPQLSLRTVQDFLQIPIQYYVVIDWQSFIKVVDILGGVDLTIEHDMNYDDPYENLNIHLTKGNQHLDGKKAGEYVRYRHDELGDIGRVERQQHFLQSLNRQMLQSSTILKLPSLMTTISKYVHTDMTLSAFAKVGNTLRDMKADSFHTEMLPGDFATIDDISYWLPNRNKTQALVKELFGDSMAPQ